MSSDLFFSNHIASPNSIISLKRFCKYCKKYGHLISTCSKLEAKGKKSGYSTSTKSHTVTRASNVTSTTKSTASRDISPKFSLKDI